MATTRKRRPSDRDKEKSDSAKKSVSKTLPVVIIWCLIFPIIAVLNFFFGNTMSSDGVALKTVIDLSTVVYITGGCTFAYMGIEYGASFIQNKQLPQGIGYIENLRRYMIFTYMWIAYLILAVIGVYAFNVTYLPIGDILIISGSLSVTYVAGNKANKIAQNM